MIDTIIRPADLGLPGHFTAFRTRPDQYAAVCALAADRTRFSELSSPPGSGKSVLYMALSQVLEAKRTLILTGTKGLQSQLTGDFESMGLVDIRGQANYPCAAVAKGGVLSDFGIPGSTCAEGPCRVGVKCPLKRSGCGYYDAQNVASNAPMVVANYAYWLTLGRHSDPQVLGLFDLLICDEAHSVPVRWLADFCAVKLYRHELKSTLDLTLPPINEGTAVWAAWASMAVDRARDRYSLLKRQLDEAGTDRRALTKRLLRLGSLGRDLLELSRAGEWQRALGTAHRDAQIPGQETDWIPESNPEGVTFSPVWAHAYAERYLFRSIPRVVLCSGTLTPSTGKYLGLSREESTYHEVDSGFDAARRPVIYCPTVKVDHRMSEGELRVMVNRIDRIIGDRLTRKGIIHTHSYKYAQEILSRSKFSHLMIGHTTANLHAAVMEYRMADAPAVLVSPSLTEGFDFPNDECRYQIIVKLPFLDTRNPLTKARLDSDRMYGVETTTQAIMQRVGRAVRSADDWAEAVVIDSHFGWFMSKGTFPRWFRQSFRTERGEVRPMSPPT